MGLVCMAVLLLANPAGAAPSQIASRVVDPANAGSGALSRSGSGIATPSGVEVVEQRSRHARTFRGENGRLTTRVSQEPLNYTLDGGDTWRAIDNRLVVLSGDYAARNAANAYDARLPRSLADPVTFTVGQRWVSFALRGAATEPPEIAGDSATYEISEHISARYTMRGSGVREILTLASAQAPSTFHYHIKASAGLTPRITTTGGVAFSDNAGHVHFGFAAPTLFDANDVAGRVRFTLDRAASGWTLTLRIARGWLSSPTRAFPVVLDPDVFWADAGYLRLSEADQDCYLESGAPTTSTCSLPNLKVGRTPSAQQKTVMRFAVEDAIPPTAQVLDARLGLVLSGRSGSPTATDIELHRVTVPWTNAATWNTTDGSTSWPSGAIGSSVAGPAVAMGATNRVYEWEPTELVQDWIARDVPNHGLALQAASASPENQFEFVSSDGFSADVPYLDVKWLPAIGQVGHYTLLPAPGTDTHQVKVNVATGNVVVEATDAPLSGFDEGLARAFNSLGTWFIWADHGPGWTAGLEGGLWLEESDLDGSVQVGLTDGAALTFLPNGDGSFRSREPQYATLTANIDDSYTLHLNDGTVTGTDYRIFADQMQPRSAQRGTSTVSLAQRTTLNRLITDSSSRTLEVQRRSGDGNIIGNTDQGSGRTLELDYRSDGTLRTATAPERSSDYVYDGFRGPVTSIVETPGDSIAFDYDNSGRVTEVTRTSASGTVEMSFDYQSPTAPCNPARDVGKTVVTTPEATTEQYCYDERARVTYGSGRPILTLSGDLYDMRGQYTNGEGSKALTVTATDPVGADEEPGSGIRRLAIQDTTYGILAQTEITCTTQRCPSQATANLTVALDSLVEGEHTLHVVSTDRAGNKHTSDDWTILIDRTGPTLPGTVDATLDEGSGTADLAWDPANDPSLPTGHAGSGFASFQVRARPQGGAWPAYVPMAADEYPILDLGSHQVSDQIEYEIKAYDAVGNVSVFTATTAVALTEITASNTGDLAPGEANLPAGDPDPGEDDEWRDVDPDEETDTPAPEEAEARGAAPAEEPAATLESPVERAFASSYDTELCARDGNASPCGQYSGKTAAKYARDHWNHYNPDYTYYSSDCTNFASQALHFGGFHYMRTAPGINDPRHDDNDLYEKGSGSWWSQKYTNNFGTTRFRNSNSWSVGWVLYNQLTDHGLARVVSPSERIRSGDLVFYWWQGGTQIDQIDHVNIVADVRKTVVRIAQHANDRLNSWTWWLGEARRDNPNMTYVVLRPTKTRFDLP